MLTRRMISLRLVGLGMVSFRMVAAWMLALALTANHRKRERRDHQYEHKEVYHRFHHGSLSYTEYDL